MRIELARLVNARIMMFLAGLITGLSMSAAYQTREVMLASARGVLEYLAAPPSEPSSLPGPDAPDELELLPRWRWDRIMRADALALSGGPGGGAVAATARADGWRRPVIDSSAITLVSVPTHLRVRIVGPDDPDAQPVWIVGWLSCLGRASASDGSTAETLFSGELTWDVAHVAAVARHGVGGLTACSRLEDR